MSIPGLIVAAPASGQGKTTVTLALARLLTRQGRRVAVAKSGPDYIDAAYAAAAAGRDCWNLDAWAMRGATLDAVRHAATQDADLLLVEGAMGLFDGAADGTGAAADLAARFGLPVLLVVDAARQSQSVAALVRGFRDHRADVAIAGVILNRVGSARHEALLRGALQGIGMPVLAALPREDALARPSRHLGLQQAGEMADLAAYLDRAADWLAARLDLSALTSLLRARPGRAAALHPIPPLGQRIAFARDTAFAFSYPHLLAGWRAAGATLHPFSALNDEAPDDDADAVYLPGGYPELHAAQLAAAKRALEGLRRAAARGAWIYGECGGFMLLGRALIDGAGAAHAMAGLLPVTTSFAKPQRHLGYRRIRAGAPTPLGPAGARFRGHEFHHSTLIAQEGGTPLFEAADAQNENTAAQGCLIGRVFGSYLHLIDAED